MNTQQASTGQGFNVSAPSAVMQPGHSVDDIEIGAFDHFSMPTKIAIGSGILLAGGAAGYGAFALGNSALAGGAVAAEGASAAGFVGAVVGMLPLLGGMLAAGAVSYGTYKVIERLVGGPTQVSKKAAVQALAKTDIDPALISQVVDAIQQETIRRAKVNEQVMQQAVGAAA